MIPALIGVTAVVAGALIGYAAYWLVVDSRERARERDRADAFVRAHRAQIHAYRYLHDDEGRPE